MPPRDPASPAPALLAPAPDRPPPGKKTPMQGFSPRPPLSQRDPPARPRHVQVSVQAQVLLYILAIVRVVPVEAGIRKMDAIRKPPARRDGILGDARSAVEPVVQPDAVPVHCRRLVNRVDELDGDG